MTFNNMVEESKLKITIFRARKMWNKPCKIGMLKHEVRSVNFLCNQKCIIKKNQRNDVWEFYCFKRNQEHKSLMYHF